MLAGAAGWWMGRDQKVIVYEHAILCVKCLLLNILGLYIIFWYIALYALEIGEFPQSRLIFTAQG